MTEDKLIFDIQTLSTPRLCYFYEQEIGSVFLWKCEILSHSWPGLCYFYDIEKMTEISNMVKNQDIKYDIFF